ncbi:MAG: hypothetical protein AMS16_03140 [Planctomycetes bacterium DG_58]|nr:MAG: hypothetical protein AMS16_03140 [Planctomycetes bacterium DG_58]
MAAQVMPEPARNKTQTPSRRVGANTTAMAVNMAGRVTANTIETVITIMARRVKNQALNSP